MNDDMQWASIILAVLLALLGSSVLAWVVIKSDSMEWVNTFGGAALTGLGAGYLLWILLWIYEKVFDKVLSLFRVKRAFVRWLLLGMPGKEKHKGGND